MRVRFIHGVRVGGLTFDPTTRVPTALWTHRPRRRPPARVVLASAPLAEGWDGVQGLPLGRSAVAGGQLLELLPTGYGVGGAAALLTEAGFRVMVVGPTAEALGPRRVDELVLFAPRLAPIPADWLDQARAATAPLRLRALDGAGARALCAALDAAEVPHRRPPWMRPGPRGVPVSVSTHGPGLLVDLRPQASAAWLVDFARACSPTGISVHGPGAEALARRLTEVGLPARVIHAPAQLDFEALSAHDARELPLSLGPMAGLPPDE